MSVKKEQAGDDIPNGYLEQHTSEIENKLRQHINRKPNDFIRLMVQNETTIYAYWNITDMKKVTTELQFEEPWSKLMKGLKIYDVTNVAFNSSNEIRSFTIPIQDDVTNKFISHLDVNRTYLLEYGIIENHDQFFTILRSKVAHTPPNKIKERDIVSENRIDWKITRYDSDNSWMKHFSTYTYYEPGR